MSECVESERRPEEPPVWLVGATMLGAVFFWTIAACAAVGFIGYGIALSAHWVLG